ncbi:hypothetical protein [Nocardia asteroides]|uniref:hypothetical protein n=1 Tax=Nocardia asteroides TaxID=1824 RepID=UPI001E2D201C|nr:hypothetical protein [Nocardia asteroides]UGT59788.1 hypothetical protein LTT61_21490 [Nocardia asteroides]
MQKVVRLVLTICIGLAVIACGTPDDRADCAGSFDFRSRDEPLGSETTLEKTMAAAAKEPRTIALGELTANAAWDNTGWDRLVLVASGVQRERLDAVAGTPAGFCWENLPEFYSDRTAERYRLFLLGNTPRQVVTETPGSELIRSVPSDVVLTPDSRLLSVQPDPGLTKPYFVRAPE